MTQMQSTLFDLYTEDEYAWMLEMLELIRDERYQELDYVHLAEELELMANREKSEVKSRLRVLVMHTLKWNFQPEKRTTSWDTTIRGQQRELSDITENSRLLYNVAQEVLETVYEQAVKDAIRETGLDRSAFPAACPYTLDMLLEEAD